MKKKTKYKNGDILIRKSIFSNNNFCVHVFLTDQQELDPTIISHIVYKHFSFRIPDVAISNLFGVIEHDGYKLYRNGEIIDEKKRVQRRRYYHNWKLYEP